jgi:1,2-diacylglycerol 3-alpha-glucosyltransferase
MRIGMMSDMYTPYISGVTTYISLYKLYLERLGHEVFIFTFGDNRFKKTDEPNVIRTPGWPFAKGQIHINFFYNGRAKRLMQTMDVLHVHHPFVSGTIAIRYFLSKKIPLVFTNHTRYDLYTNLYLPWWFRGVSNLYVNTYLRLFYSRLNALIVPTTSMRKVVERFGKNLPIVVEPHGVDLHSFLASAAPIDRSSLGFTPEDVVIVYVGRLGVEKNLVFLLQAFAKIAATHERARLLLVGDGPLKPALVELSRQSGLQSRITFTGMIPHAELSAYYKAADFFVTASKTETFGLTIVEAMACGLPVIGIESPGVGDTVVRDETGFLVNDDLQEYANRMSRLVENPALRQQMAERACLEAQHYAIENAVERLEAIYRNLILLRPKNDQKRIPVLT